MCFYCPFSAYIDNIHTDFITFEPVLFFLHIYMYVYVYTTVMFVYSTLKIDLGNFFLYFCLYKMIFFRSLDLANLSLCTRKQIDRSSLGNFVSADDFYQICGCT